MEEYKGCDNCLHECKDETDEPCCKCKNSAHPFSEEYSRRLFLWEAQAEAQNKDMVNHPSHYETGKFECIDVMIETQGVEAVKHFCICNAFKYLYRHSNKNGTEDIKKAIWYLNKYVELEGD